MERLETLLKIDMGSRFDTRKTLNRSEHKVPDNILDQIESGSFTCEMIDELAQRFPIFRYQTQITIHGEFDVKNTRIASYKNIFQNGNLSLGVKYSAIDTEKINRIREMLGKTSIYGDNYKIKFNYLHNSQHRVFRMSQSINKDNMVTIRQEYIELANKIKEVSIYGFVDCYIMPLPWSGHEIVLDVHPLAIPENKITELVYAMLNMDENSYNERVKVVDAIYKERKEKEHKEKEERDALSEAKKKRRIEYMAPYKEAGNLNTIVNLTDKNVDIVVKFSVDESGESGQEFVFKEYVFYRIGGKGSFGKVKVQKAFSPTFDLSNLVWEDHGKQMKLSEVRIKGYLVVSQPKTKPVLETVVVNKVTPVKEKEVVTTTGNISGVYIVDYSERSIAVLGDTKPYKEILGVNGLGGRFNFNLTVNDKKVAGWIFPKSRLNDVKSKLKLN